MSFPTSPTNNQITTVNGIRYYYASANNAWIRISSAKFTAAATGPSNPAAGDQWYDTTDDVLYEWIFDGTNSYWVDIQSGIVGGTTTATIPTNFTSNIIVSNTTPSTSTVTGALVTLGGAGVDGNLYATTIYTVNGIRWASNGNVFAAGGSTGSMDILHPFLLAGM